MILTSKAKHPYFSHDLDVRGDKKIKKMLLDYRKKVKSMSREELECLAAISPYAIFWAVVEYAHRNGLNPESVEIIADELRLGENFVKSVIEDFGFFRFENDEYISDRILRNLEEQEEKSKRSQTAAKFKWALSNLKKVYNEIFGENPILSEKEKPIYFKHDTTIPDFRKKLPDILLTLKFLKFDNNKDFKPSINWLLADNHLETLMNGGYGKLKSWSEYKTRLKAAETEKLQLETQRFDSLDLKSKIETISGKAAALEFIADYYASRTFIEARNKAKVVPDLRRLMEKFDITDREVIERCRN